MVKPKSKDRLKMMNKAYKMYINDSPYSDIAKNVGVSTQTIVEWVKKEGWKDRKLKIIETAEMELDSTLTEEKIRTLKIIHEAEDKFIEALKNGEITIDPRSLSRLMRVKLDMLMPRINPMIQQNFIKQDVQNNQLQIQLESAWREIIEEKRKKKVEEKEVMT